jgi:hypothetical protein
MLSASAVAHATVHPRALVLIDTSSTMTRAIDDPTQDTGADGSTSYADAFLTRNLSVTPGFAYGVGFSLPANQCSTPPGTIVSDFRGSSSKMFAAKQAFTNLVTGSSTIDWGLMRYSGSSCPISAGPLSTRSCTSSSQCVSGNCTNSQCVCAHDGQCNKNEFCVSGRCRQDPNLCVGGMYSMTDTRGDGICKDRTASLYSLPGTYAGSCGTSGTSGQCSAPQTCATDGDCMGGGCLAVTGSGAKACACAGTVQCPNNYACVANRCSYNASCVVSGGVVLVDPTSSVSNASIVPWLDGHEDDTGVPGAAPPNPELRASGNTPLAGSIRTAAQWFQAIRDYTLDVVSHPNCMAGARNDPNPLCDPFIQCRAYRLVEIVDGVDSCESDSFDAPTVAARKFVSTTVPGAHSLNQVHVVALAVNAAGGLSSLNELAAAGGTGNATVVNSEAELESALHAISATWPTPVETCNGLDDDCNGVIDDCTPNVAGSCCKLGGAEVPVQSRTSIYLMLAVLGLVGAWRLRA